MVVRIFLALMALMFVAFGLYAFLAPLAMTAGLGVDVSGPNGAYEVRGIYGGVSVAAGALCAAGALRDALRRPALWFIATYMGGYGLARAAALLVGPPPTSGFAVFIVFEVASFGLALIALWASARA